jgi:hypothetical protein
MYPIEQPHNRQEGNLNEITFWSAVRVMRSRGTCFSVTVGCGDTTPVSQRFQERATFSTRSDTRASEATRGKNLITSSSSILPRIIGERQENKTSNVSPPAVALTRLANAVISSSKSFQVRLFSMGMERVVMNVNFLNRGDATVLSIGMIFSNPAWANSPRISTRFLQGERSRTRPSAQCFVGQT